jgi:hypothetical protein
MTSNTDFFQMRRTTDNGSFELGGDEDSEDFANDGPRTSENGTYVLNNHKILISFLNVLIKYIQSD